MINDFVATSSQIAHYHVDSIIASVFHVATLLLPASRVN